MQGLPTTANHNYEHVFFYTDDLEEVELTSVEAELEQSLDGVARRLTLFNDTYLRVRSRHPAREPAEYWLNLAFLVAGLSNSTWQGTPLPRDLGGFGMPGCQALVSVDVAFAAISTGSTVAWTIPICNCPPVVGATFYHQALVLDPNAGNPAGAAVSNAATAVVGAR